MKKGVEYDDVDDIIEIAVRMKHASAQQLTLTDLEEVAEELSIPAEYVKEAVDELQRRRESEKKERDQRRQLYKKIAAGTAAAAAFLFAISAHHQSSLRADLNQARQQQAQVVNVMERQTATLEQWADAPESRDRSAELSGAQNRVSIERRRYDEAVTQYNNRVEGFPSTLWVNLLGFPAELPLSNQVEEW